MITAQKIFQYKRTKCNFAIPVYMRKRKKKLLYNNDNNIDKIIIHECGHKL